MNQVVRQKAGISVEEDFYKLMNYPHFGIDCRNNIDNCWFEAVYDEINETAYIKKYADIYDNEQYKDFASPKTMKEEIEGTFN